MSGIQLTNDLVAKLKSVLVEHDSAAEDEMMYMQYLSAITGYVLAHHSQPGLDKKEFIEGLAGFTGQVLNQVSSDLKAQQPAEDAFGIWKPE